MALGLNLAIETGTEGAAPSDAESVYNNAIRDKLGTWYGIGENGKVYQYYLFFGDQGGLPAKKGRA